MRVVKKIINLSLIIMVLCLLTGCLFMKGDELPIFEKIVSDDGGWYTEIENVEYAIWPDHSWILLSNESGDTIGYLETQDTVLSNTLGDLSKRYLQVHEKSSDLLHVPLVWRELKQEFSIQRIDGIEWVNTGIRGESFQELLGHSIVDDHEAIVEFISAFQEKPTHDNSVEWQYAGSLFCYNVKLPSVVYALRVEHYDGVLKCQGYNGMQIYYIDYKELVSILGYELMIEGFNS